MPDAVPPRLAFKVELVSAASIDGTDRMLVTLRTDTGAPVEVRLTRAEAAQLVALIILERSRVPSTDLDAIGDD